MNETLSPGKYYLGDPTFVLHDKITVGIWGELYNYSNGKFYIYGEECVFHSTHKGDDTFTDAKKRKYTVVSGVLSLISIHLIEDIQLCKNNGHIFEFTKKVKFIYDAGIFYITSDKKRIMIDTRNMEEYISDDEDRYEEHCEDDHEDAHESSEDKLTEGELSDNELSNNLSDKDSNEENNAFNSKDTSVFNFFKKNI